jgi:hypothetical protein
MNEVYIYERVFNSESGCERCYPNQRAPTKQAKARLFALRANKNHCYGKTIQTE